MRCKEVIKYIEQWAPKGIALQNDNVGLQIGNPESIIKNIMLSLDLSEGVIEQATEKNRRAAIKNLIILFQELEIKI
jgi:putative NIF3 family GTP cyclohydrolase 1 type 2